MVAVARHRGNAHPGSKIVISPCCSCPSSSAFVAPRKGLLKYKVNKINVWRSIVSCVVAPALCCEAAFPCLRAGQLKSTPSLTTPPPSTRTGPCARTTPGGDLKRTPTSKHYGKGSRTKCPYTPLLPNTHNTNTQPKTPTCTNEQHSTSHQQQHHGCNRRHAHLWPLLRLHRLPFPPNAAPSTKTQLKDSSTGLFHATPPPAAAHRPHALSHVLLLCPPRRSTQEDRAASFPRLCSARARAAALLPPLSLLYRGSSPCVRSAVCASPHTHLQPSSSPRAESIYNQQQQQQQQRPGSSSAIISKLIQKHKRSIADFVYLFTHFFGLLFFVFPTVFTCLRALAFPPPSPLISFTHFRDPCGARYPP